MAQPLLMILWLFLWHKIPNFSMIRQYHQYLWTICRELLRNNFYITTHTHYHQQQHITVLWTEIQ